jgi:ankyrin repeat protein
MRRTSAQLFWQLYLLRSDFQHFRQHPVVAHARNDCILGPVHQLCIDYAEKDELDRQIALDPGCVNSRDCYGFTPLHWAVRSGNVDAVDILLQAGADVNAVCNAGRPVLSWSESWTICKMLLDSGADIRIIENNGNDAIFCAINSESSIAVIELLLEASSKFDERLDIDGSTYLMVAMLTGLMDICELILEYTTNISAQDKFGFSALTYAIRHNFHAGMELLLDHGADTTQLDCDGDSIIVLVALFGDIETMRILEYEQIKGLPMEPLDVDFYWAEFRGLRHRYFLGWTAPVEEEEEAFQAFLDSITPCDPKGPPNRKPLHVPGAFSVSDDDSEDDVELGNSDTETVDYESCDEEFVLHGSDGYDAKPQYEIVIRPQSRGKDVRGGTVDAIV